MADDIKQVVRDKYGEVARARDGGGCGCCGGDPIGGESFAEDYGQLDGYLPEADLGLGCGLPTRDAFVRPGDTVLDLGSGAGNDVFVARALTGPTGHVIGVDMVPEMVARARANAERLGAANVTFHLGEIEALPLDEATIDVVISNCVLNLVPDKARAFAEIRRVLRPGGHFSVSDIVLVGQLPEGVRESAVMYAGCVAGALQEQEYLDVITAAGFVDVQVRKRKRIDLPDELLAQALPPAEAAAFRASGAGIWSLTVFGRRAEG